VKVVCRFAEGRVPIPAIPARRPATGIDFSKDPISLTESILGISMSTFD